MIQTEVGGSLESFDYVKRYFFLLLSWLWLIILVGLVAGGVAYLISIQTTPIYQTTTRLLVSNPPSMGSLTNSSVVDAQSMTGTYSEMLLDRPVLQGVIDKLKLPITSDQLKKMITITAVRNTQLLEVTVNHPNPLLAADIANTIGLVFSERIGVMQSVRYASTQAGLAKQVAEMEKQVNETTTALTVESDPARKLQLEARLTEYQRLYSELVTNFEQVRLAEAQTSTNIFVSEPASIPRSPISPNVSKTTLQAMLVGALLATALVVGWDFLDDTIKNPDEIRTRFNLPVLGMIALHKTQDGKPVCQAEPRSPVAEAFRSLRTNITYAAVDTPLRRILVTSPTPQDGKTTVSSNLAVILAQSEKRVVLIDADLRRPQIHRKFSLLNRVGLSDLFVRSMETLNGALQTCEVPRLSVITSGRVPPNPSELLTSQKMGQILERLGQDHDLILIDTPPLLSVTDAAALSTSVDGVLLVVKPGVTKVGALAQSIGHLEAVGGFILGVVLNGVEPRSRKYGYYYDRYYSKYSNYYDSDGKKTKNSSQNGS